MEDEKIIDLYWERNQSAISQTEQKYGGYCRGIARHILYNREDCEECINDTWLRAWNSMPEERPSILSAFLGAITRNMCLDCYRRQHTAKRGAGEVAYIFDEMRDCVSQEEPGREMEMQELTESINRFLAGMEQGNRVIFVRRYWYMDSVAEIAERFLISEEQGEICAVPRQKKLRTHLQREGFEL